MTKTFGDRVRQLRQERRWSQAELSNRSYISTPHISSIESAKRHPSLEYALRLAAAFGVPLQALCDETVELRSPKMRASAFELPLFLQNFVLNEEATPYLQTAHRLSTLPPREQDVLSRMIELLATRHRQAPLVENRDAYAESPELEGSALI